MSLSQCQNHNTYKTLNILQIDLIQFCHNLKKINKTQKNKKNPTQLSSKEVASELYHLMDPTIDTND